MVRAGMGGGGGRAVGAGIERRLSGGGLDEVAGRCRRARRRRFILMESK